MKKLQKLERRLQRKRILLMNFPSPRTRFLYAVAYAKLNNERAK